MVFIIDDNEIENKQKGRRCPPPGVPAIEVRFRHAVSGAADKIARLCLDFLHSVRLLQRSHQLPRLFSFYGSRS